tara:strand:- start:470 stop:2125 length:1656 start_codon:yes stop_codon:yes gene_type:complete
MEAFIYLGKSSLVLSLFYCCFQLFLRNETFFTAKRWFLMAGIAIAMIFPFVILKRIVAISTPSFDINAFVNATTNAEIIIESTDWWFVGVTIYAAGVAFFLIRFGIQLLSLRKLISEGEIEKKDRYKMVRISADTSAFSFFNYIVYNPELYTEKQLETILDHEKLHSIQKHSIDMLLVHLVCMLQWANPFAWLYKKTLSQNLEFLADMAITTNLNNKKEYQYLLLQQSNPTLASVSFTNTFFNSIIKKRIVMLNKKKSKKQSLLKMGVVVPFLAIALFTINTKTIAQIPMSVSTTASVVKPWGITTGVQITSKSTDEELKSIKGQIKELKINLKFEKVKRNVSGEIVAISSSYSSSEGSSGRMNKKGDKPITPFSFFVNRDVVTGNVLSIGYKTTPEEDFNANKNNFRGVSSTKQFVEGIEDFDENSVIMVDGKEMDFSYDLDNINVEEISGLSVFTKKDEKTIIKITTKINENDTNASHSMNRITVVGHNAFGDKKPLIVIDGKEMKSSFDVEAIDPDNIKSINVFKGKTATDTYGKKGKNGVIEITTKK